MAESMYGGFKRLGTRLGLGLGLMAMLAACSGNKHEPKPVQEPIDYEIDGEMHRGYLVYDASVSKARPLVVVVPNWLGVTEASLAKAQRAAGEDYVLFVADMFGVDHQPVDTEAAGAAVAALYSNRMLLRERANAALQTARDLASATDKPWRADPDRIAAIGFCFGGATVLELARSGADVDAVVSFHGNLALSGDAPQSVIRSRVLVLHGDADPYVPVEEVRAFEEEMRAIDVDWQMVSYGGAVHSFTNPLAQMPGQAMYDEAVAKDAFRQMRAFLADTFDAQ
jgi:dienelactone hydrolase